MIALTLNGQRIEVGADPDTPLLWVLRETLGLTGTKFGCGMAQCGACTVHIGGSAERSCVVPLSAVEGAEIRTIEGLAQGDRLHPVQQAWAEIDVPQCGYCQSGQIMTAVALLAETPRPTDTQISEAMTNFCRCGTYPYIRAAIHRAAELLAEGGQ